MKQFLDILNQLKNHKTLIGASICILLIWSIGPSISIAQVTPFAYLPIQLVTTLLIVTHALVKLQPKTLYLRYKVHTSSALAKRFVSAIKFLQKTTTHTREGKKTLDTLPWFFLLGLPGTGKTSLMANAGIRYVLSKKLKTIKPTEQCDWWISKRSVFLDIPGNFLLSKEQHHWQELLKLLKKYADPENTKGIVLTLNVNELTKSKKFAETLFTLKEHVLSLQKALASHIPVYILINYCDNIPGFSSFFSSLTKNESEKPLGFDLHASTLPQLKKQCHQQFFALVERIQKSLVKQLKDASSVEHCLLMKDFPSELLHLHDALQSMLTRLHQDNATPINIKGIYFCNAAQATLPATQKSSMNAGATHPAFFTHDLLAETLPGQVWHSEPSKPRWINQTLAGIVFIGLLFISTKWIQDFYAHKQFAQQTENALASYEKLLSSTQPQTLSSLEPTLTSLIKVKQQLQKDKLTLPKGANPVANQQLAHTVTAALNGLIDKKFIPLLKQILENKIQMHMQQKHFIAVYATLKAYLMLENKQYFNANYLAKIIEQTTNNQTDTKALTALFANIKKLHRPTNLNQALIQRAQSFLQQLKLAQKITIVLQNNHRILDKPIFNLEKSHWLTLNEKQNALPDAFTPKQLDAILSKEIPNLSARREKENWVIGTKLDNQNMSEEQFTTLTSQLYLTQYGNAWKKLMSQITPTSPKSITQAREILAELTRENSPLFQILSTVRNYTNDPMVQTFNPQLAQLDALITDNKQPSQVLSQTLMTVAQLNGQLMQVSRSADPETALFEFSKKLLVQHEKTGQPVRLIDTRNLPEPLKQWFTQLSSDVWKLMVQNAIRHLKIQASIQPSHLAAITNDDIPAETQLLAEEPKPQTTAKKPKDKTQPKKKA